MQTTISKGNSRDETSRTYFSIGNSIICVYLKKLVQATPTYARVQKLAETKLAATLAASVSKDARMEEADRVRSAAALPRFRPPPYLDFDRRSAPPPSAAAQGRNQSNHHGKNMYLEPARRETTRETLPPSCSVLQMRAGTRARGSDLV
jgi:hypothetical protein